MAPKRKPERKAGIHTLDGTPPSKKAKTAQATPKATGVHTLADSNTQSKATPSNVVSKKELHALANVRGDHDSPTLNRGEKSLAAHNDEDDGDYVEDGATLDPDDGGLGHGLSNDAQVRKELNNIHDARDHQVDAEGLRLTTRSQSKAAIRHKDATRAKLTFLARLSRGTEKTAGKVVEAEDSGTDGMGKEPGAEV